MLEKKRELILIHIGQAGILIGDACWELYCLEHGLQSNGRFPVESPSKGTGSAEVSRLNPLFNETSPGKHVPRALFVDVESSVVNRIRNGKYRDLYNPENIINGNENTADNYARGFYTVGKKIIDSVTDRIRKLTEECSGLDGFMLFHSLSGGTGSGFSSLLMQSLETEYRKNSRFEFAVYPSSLTPVATYNAVLGTHSSIDYSDCTFLIDNHAIFDICSRQLNMRRPTFENVNQLIAQIVSSITVPMRFDGCLNVNIEQLQTNLFPFPRLHFPLVSYAPFCPEENFDLEIVSVENITNACFDASNHILKCNPNRGRYMACSMLYRGDVALQDANAAIDKLRQNKRISSVNWCPTGFKIGINSQPPMQIPGSGVAKVDRSVCTISNNTSITDAWHCLNNKFDLMLKRRAFVYRYINEGLDINEFEHAREDLRQLESDYNAIDQEDFEANFLSQSDQIMEIEYS